MRQFVTRALVSSMFHVKHVSQRSRDRFTRIMGGFRQISAIVLLDHPGTVENGEKIHERRLMGLPRENRLVDNAYYLRRNMTLAEKRLWFEFLREYPIPFRTQKIIGPYIVDFFCNRVRISIELDGSQHYEEKQSQKDIIRTTYLNMLEIKELRFANTDIWDNFEGVCESIHFEIQKRRNDLIRVPLSIVKSKY